MSGKLKAGKHILCTGVVELFFLYERPFARCFRPITPAHDNRSGDLVSHEVTRIATRSAFWELEADYAEVVSKTLARTPIPHAPGVRMT